MIPFHSVFPEVALRETRSFVLEDAGAPGDIPADAYAFVEFYCEENGCDCRRAMLSVLSKASGRELVRISHAFEPPKKGPAAALGQTYLEPLGPSVPYAALLLGLFKERVLDDEYARRLERHYSMVKEAIADPKNPIQRLLQTETGQRGVPITRERYVGPNQPCPCGSGRKHKRCCGRLI